MQSSFIGRELLLGGGRKLLSFKLADRRCVRLIETLPAFRDEPDRLEDALKMNASDCRW
jgi:hypothetical protein